MRAPTATAPQLVHRNSKEAAGAPGGGSHSQDGKGRARESRAGCPPLYPPPPRPHTHSKPLTRALASRWPPPPFHAAVTLSMPALLDLVESILAGKPVALEHVEALHQMLTRGELITQGSRIREELIEKEELDQDVGLNLLQVRGWWGLCLPKRARGAQ